MFPLIALKLFEQSRAATRLDADGQPMLIDDQDRSLWNAASIDEGIRMLAAAEHTLQYFGTGPRPYLIQAQIAANHATASTAEATDFARVADLYARLSEFAPSPIVDVNRAIAVALSPGPDAGLALLDTLDIDVCLAEYHRLHATRVDFLRRLGNDADAVPRYRRALDLAPSDPGPASSSAACTNRQKSPRMLKNRPRSS